MTTTVNHHLVHGHDETGIRLDDIDYGPTAVSITLTKGDTAVTLFVDHEAALALVGVAHAALDRLDNLHEAWRTGPLHERLAARTRPS